MTEGPATLAMSGAGDIGAALSDAGAEAAMKATTLWAEMALTWIEHCGAMAQAGYGIWIDPDFARRLCALHLRNAGLCTPLLNDA